VLVKFTVYREKVQNSDELSDRIDIGADCVSNEMFRQESEYRLDECRATNCAHVAIC
jgi:hypothetical protein